MKLHPIFGIVALSSCAALGQQTNSGNARMTIDAVDGPPFPIQMNVRTNVTSTFQIQGATNAAFLIVASGNGNLSVGSASYFGDSYDLPQSPPYVVCVNGLTNPVFTTDLTGQFSFNVTCPPVGSPPSGLPLNFKAAYQTAMVDYFSPYGWSLTAATRANVTQGPIVVNLNTGIGTYGDSGVTMVNLSSLGLSFPFYGVNYSAVYISGDGFMTLGSPPPGGDYVCTDIGMKTGVPRIAGFWTDLDQITGQFVRYTIDANPPPGMAPFMNVEFINVMDAVLGYLHTFSWRIDTLGNVNIAQAATNNPSVYAVIVGMTPGNNLNPQPPKNLAALLSPSFYQGGVNESFYEWFGIVTQNQYYTLPYDNFYDLASRTLNFLPTGTGTLPGSTNQYVLY